MINFQRCADELNRRTLAVEGLVVLAGMAACQHDVPFAAHIDGSEGLLVYAGAGIASVLGFHLVGQLGAIVGRKIGETISCHDAAAIGMILGLVLGGVVGAKSGYRYSVDNFNRMAEMRLAAADQFLHKPSPSLASMVIPHSGFAIGVPRPVP